MKFLIAHSSIREAHALGADARDAANDEFPEAECIAIDMAGLADKARNGYDERRVAAAARLEASNPIFGGGTR